MDPQNLEPSSSNKKFLVTTQDGVRLEVKAEVAMEMKTLKSLIDQDDWSNGPSVIPLSQVSSDSFQKIAHYIKTHRNLKEKAKKYGELAEFARTYQRKFLDEYDFDAIKKLFLAAEYLKVEEFGDFLIQATRDQIQNKSLKDVRKFFGIKKETENRGKKNSRPLD